MYLNLLHLKLRQKRFIISLKGYALQQVNKKENRGRIYVKGQSGKRDEYE